MFKVTQETLDFLWQIDRLPPMSTRHYVIQFNTWSVGRNGSYGTVGAHSLDARTRQNAHLSPSVTATNRCVEIEDESGRVVERWTYWTYSGDPVWLPDRIEGRQAAESAISAGQAVTF